MKPVPEDDAKAIRLVSCGPKFSLPHHRRVPTPRGRTSPPEDKVANSASGPERDDGLLGKTSSARRGRSRTAGSRRATSASSTTATSSSAAARRRSSSTGATRTIGTWGSQPRRRRAQGATTWWRSAPAATSSAIASASWSPSNARTCRKPGRVEDLAVEKALRRPGRTQGSARRDGAHARRRRAARALARVLEDDVERQAPARERVSSTGGELTSRKAPRAADKMNVLKEAAKSQLSLLQARGPRRSQE